MSLKEELFSRLRDAVLSGDPDEVVKLCRSCLLYTSDAADE